MARTRELIIWTFCLVTTGLVSAQTGTDMKNLYTYLFTTLGYNKDIRPAQNQSAPTDVSVELLLSGFHGLYESNEQMSSVGILTVKWKDEFLSWTPSTYGGATFIDVPQGLVWKPDLQVQNSLGGFAELGGSFMTLRIFNTGNISWMPYKTFNTKCVMDITLFPFDQQVCSIDIVAWNSDATIVSLSQGTSGLQLDDDIENGQWALSSPSTNAFVDDGESFIRFSMTIRRKPKTYILNIIIPMTFLVVLDIFTFTLPNDCGEKMSYSVAILLSIYIVMTIVSSSLPSTSSTSYLEIFLLMDILLGALILMITAVSLRIHQRSQDRKIPQWIQKLTLLSWKLRCRMPSTAVEDDGKDVSKMDIVSFADDGKDKMTTSEKSNSENEVTVVLWTDVTSALDFYMFLTFSFICLFTTILLIGLTV